MNKLYFFAHPSWKSEIERIQALETFDNHDDALTREVLNSVEVVYQGRLPPFREMTEPKNNLFTSPPDASIRKLVKGWKC